MEIIVIYIYPILVSLLASIYASLICAKIIIFNSIKNKCKEVLFLNSGPFSSSSDVNIAIKNFEYFEYVCDNLSLLDHIKASKTISDLKFDIIKNLNDIESDFTFSEVRHKFEVTDNSITKFQDYYRIIDELKGNKMVFLKINFKA